MDAGAFLAHQLYSAASSTKGRIVVGRFVATIACFFNIIPHDDDWVPGSKRFDKPSFELLSFCKLEASRLCRIYLEG